MGGGAMSNLERDAEMCWYVIHTKPHQEERADSNLRAWGIETFSPWLRERRYNSLSGGLAYGTKPLFPRYIFARFNANLTYHKIRFTRGICNVISFGGVPSSVDDEIIALLKSRVGADGFVILGQDFKEGDEVVIKEGLLKNFVGIFERDVKDTNRVRVLLKAVSYQNHIIIPRDVIEHVKPAHLG